MVVAFGVSSAIDWTWFVPGVAVPALVAAGWLAGRGPLWERAAPLERRRRISTQPLLGAAVVTVAALALLGGVGGVAAASLLRCRRCRGQPR